MTPATLREVTLRGAPRERGRVHGETLREEVGAVIDAWRESIAAAVGEHPDGYIDGFLSSTAFEPGIDRWTPGLLDEVRGIAEGAAIDPRTAYALQLVDEEWSYRRSRRRAQVAERCSAFGVRRDDGTSLIAQTLDLPAAFDGHQVLLRVDDGDTQMLVPSYAGLIGLNGINSTGVALCVNSLSQLVAAPSGLPVAFVVRGVLQRATRADAADFISSVPHASGQNYLLGSADGIDDFECSAGAVVRCDPQCTRIVHTNHPLASDDLWPDSGTTVAGGEHSRARLDLLRERVLEDDTAMDASRAMALLAIPPVCRVPTHPTGAVSLFSTVMTLASEPSLDVAPGPASREVYAHVSFAARVA